MEENKTIEKTPSVETSEQGSEAAKTAADTSKQKVNIADFDDFDEQHSNKEFSPKKFEFLKDLQMNVYIELGRTQMMIKEILELERGYVIELEKMASEPVDVYVNNRKIAEGEVVVIDKHFGIRITNLNEVQNRLKGI